MPHTPGMFTQPLPPNKIIKFFGKSQGDAKSTLAIKKLYYKNFMEIGIKKIWPLKKISVILPRLMGGMCRIMADTAACSGLLQVENQNKNKKITTHKNDHRTS